MNTEQCDPAEKVSPMSPIFSKEAFARSDESNDAQLASTLGTNERVGKVDASDKMSPSFSQCGPLLWGEGGVDWFWGRAFFCESG